MVETTARLLGLLAALQSAPRVWSGPELAERFGVTVRTVRRDVDRLRQLGYPVLTTSGAAGGYQLGTGGAATPPLMLERDEAVAIAAALRAVPAAAAGASALAKLEQFLPPTARREITAVGDMTLGLGGRSAADPAMLVTLTTACRDGERLRIDYVARDATPSERLVIPLRVVHAVGRWYVVAYDRGRAEWRTFRLDRIASLVATGHRESPPDPPDPHRFVQAALSISPYRYQARVLFSAPLDVLAERIPAEAAVLTGVDDDTTLATTGGESLDWILWQLLRVGIDFTVLGPDELIEHMAAVAERLTRLTGAARGEMREAAVP